MRLATTELHLRSLQSEDEILNEGLVTRKGLRPWPIRHPIDWAADPHKEMNWRFCLHGLRMLDPIILAWIAEPTRRRIDHVLEVFRSWADYEAQMAATRPPEDEVARNSAHGVIWHDMGASIRALKLAWLLDVSQEAGITGDDLAFIEDQAALHVRRLSAPHQLSKSNHGLFQVAALEALSYLRPDAPWARDARRVAQNHLAYMIDRQFTDEGVHKEHSVGYHFFALKMMSNFKGFARLGDDRLEGILALARANNGWLRRPDGSAAPIGDTLPSRPAATVQPLSGRRYGDYVASTFHRSGYAIARTAPDTPADQGGMVFLTGMRWSASHKNDDDLSFEWFDLGGPIIVDAGKYGYVTHRFRRYAMRQTAHSTAGILQYDGAYRRLPHYGSALNATTHDGKAFTLSGQVRHHEFDQKRAIRWRPKQALTVTDVLTSKKKQDYVSRLLFDKDVIVRPMADGSVSFTCPSGATGTLHCSHGPITLHRGELEPKTLGWQTIANVTMAPATCVEVVVEAQKKATIEWSFTLQPVDKSLSAFDRWLAQGGRHLLTSEPAPSSA